MNSYLRIKKSLKTFYRFILVFVSVSILFNSCGVPTFHYPPTSKGLSAFPIENIFSVCHNPLTSTKTLAYKLVLTTYYNYTGGRGQLDQVPYTSDQINPNPNITISANIPKDGSPWTFDISVVSTQCSTCTAYWAGNTCPQSNVGNGIIAGVPTLFLSGSQTSGYSATQNPINIAISTYADANASCGCTVPQN